MVKAILAVKSHASNRWSVFCLQRPKLLLIASNYSLRCLNLLLKFKILCRRLQLLRLQFIILCFELLDGLGFFELIQFFWFCVHSWLDRFGGDDDSRLTKKAEPPPTRDVNRDSGTASANGGWLRRLVRRHIECVLVSHLKRLSLALALSHPH